MSDHERLLAALKQLAGEKRKVGLELVWTAFRDSVRGYTGNADARPRLAGLLDELSRAGALAVPRARTLWKREADPPLPMWVLLVADHVAAQPRVDPKTIAWPPELAFVASMRHVPLMADLLAIRRFLAEGGRDAAPVPLRERSLQVFDDEKRLDQLLASSLFRSGKLSLELLRCFEVAPPLVWEPGPAHAHGRSVLVVENLHTYDSFRKWNERVGEHGAVAYGHGSEFTATVRDLPRVCAHVGAIGAEYFGDLDATGLRIAVMACAELVRVQPERGLVLSASTRWYRELLAHEARARRSDSGARLDEALLGWLPAELHASVERLLSKGLRLPQELIGFVQLARSTTAGRDECCSASRSST